MKTLILILVSMVVAIPAMAQRRVLTTFSDSLSYCLSYNIGVTMVETEKGLTPQMIKETIDAFDEIAPNPAFIDMKNQNKS